MRMATQLEYEGLCKPQPAARVRIRNFLEALPRKTRTAYNTHDTLQARRPEVAKNLVMEGIFRRPICSHCFVLQIVR